MYNDLMGWRRPKFDSLPPSLHALINDIARSGSINVRCVPGQPIEHYNNGEWIKCPKVLPEKATELLLSPNTLKKRDAQDLISPRVLTKKEFKALASIFIEEPFRQARDWTHVEVLSDGYLYEGVYQPKRCLTFTIRKYPVRSTCPYDKHMEQQKQLQSINVQPENFSDLILSQAKRK